jgi:hypothetical protein
MNTVRSLQDSQQAKQKNSNKVTQQLQMARRKNSEYRSMLRSMTALMPGPTNGSVTLVKVSGRREKEGGRGREGEGRGTRRGEELGEKISACHALRFFAVFCEVTCMLRTCYF